MSITREVEMEAWDQLLRYEIQCKLMSMAQERHAYGEWAVPLLTLGQYLSYIIDERDIQASWEDTDPNYIAQMTECIDSLTSMGIVAESLPWDIVASLELRVLVEYPFMNPNFFELIDYPQNKDIQAKMKRLYQVLWDDDIRSDIKDAVRALLGWFYPLVRHAVTNIEYGEMVNYYGCRCGYIGIELNDDHFPSGVDLKPKEGK